MGIFELNEILALVTVGAAFVATIAARVHSGNTPRTRVWWSRFLAMLALLLAAEVATNLEQLWAADSAVGQTINLLEHLLLCAAAAGAMSIGVRGIHEAFRRLDGGEEGGT